MMVPGLQHSCALTGRGCGELRVRCTSRHADLPGLLAGSTRAGSPDMCVLGTSGSLHVTCGALPVLPGREGLVNGDPGPSPLATLPKLSEKDLIRAWLLCRVLSLTLACRPRSGGRYLVGSQMGTAAATSGCDDVYVSGWGDPPPPAAGTQPLPPLPSGLASKWPPGFLWLPL